MFDEDNTFDNDVQIPNNTIGGKKTSKEEDRRRKEQKEKLRKLENILRVKKQKINLLNAININNDETTLQNYYDILENLDNFLYKDIDFFNVLKSKIDQLLQYEEVSYNQIIRDYSVFTISKSFSLKKYLKLELTRKFVLMMIIYF